MNDPVDTVIGVCVLVVVLVLAIFGAIICVDKLSGNDEGTVLRAQAIQRGAAEYVMDPTTGKTTWRWKQGPVWLKFDAEMRGPE